MAPPPCSAKEAGSEKVSSTPRSQSGEVPGSVGARTSPQSPTSRPVSSLSRGEARPAVLHQDRPKPPEWSGLGSPHPDPDGWCPG